MGQILLHLLDYTLPKYTASGQTTGVLFGWAQKKTKDRQIFLAFEIRRIILLFQ